MGSRVLTFVRPQPGGLAALFLLIRAARRKRNQVADFLFSSDSFRAQAQYGNEPVRQKFWRWAITPPQSYAVYLVCLVLIFVLSFYAGTLKPKKTPTAEPPAAATPAVPRN